MQQQTGQGPRSAIARIGQGLAAALGRSWRLGRSLLFGTLNVVAALILLFEEWGWRPLMQALAWLARFRLVQRIETAIAGLPPYGALAVFALPTAVLFPLKLVALWLMAKGLVLAAGALFVAAKIASTALVARLFMLTRPALMRIGWFARAYQWFVPWKEALFAAIRSSWVWRYGRIVKGRAVRTLRRILDRLKPPLAGLRHRLARRARMLATRLRAGVTMMVERVRARRG